MPIETVYDFGRTKWIQAIALGKIGLRERDGEVIADFNTMEPKEFRMYDAYLPSSIASKTVGTTIVVQNPDRFRAWLPEDRWSGGRDMAGGFLSRIGLRRGARKG